MRSMTDRKIPLGEKNIGTSLVGNKTNGFPKDSRQHPCILKKVNQRGRGKGIQESYNVEGKQGALKK